MKYTIIVSLFVIWINVVLIGAVGMAIYMGYLAFGMLGGIWTSMVVAGAAIIFNALVYHLIKAL